MPDVTRTKLPGVGIRHEFPCRAGGRVGVLAHYSGERELLFYAPDDPDTVKSTARLSEHEALVLAELLGATHVHDSLQELEQGVEGLVIDWLPITDDAPAAGRTIADFEVRQRTGVSIVAVLRGDVSQPSPGPDHRIQPGETLVLVGTSEGVDTAEDLLAGR